MNAKMLAQLAVNIQKNNENIAVMKQRGQIVDAPEGYIDPEFRCDVCGGDITKGCLCDDEPDYMAAIHRVVAP